MPQKTIFAAWSVFAGLCVSLLVLCWRQEMTTKIPELYYFYPNGHPFVFQAIPIIMSLCAILFARRLFGWKSRILSALNMVLLSLILCGFALASADIIQELLRLTEWSRAVFTAPHEGIYGKPIMRSYLFSALAGFVMSVCCFFVLPLIRHSMENSMVLSRKTVFIQCSVFAGLCVSLFVFCLFQLNSFQGEKDAISGLTTISIILSLCAIRFAQRILGWKSRILSALTLIVLSAILCVAAFSSVAVISELLLLTGWCDTVLVYIDHGYDLPVIYPPLSSALAGLSMIFCSFFALSVIQHLSSRSTKNGSI